jgi:Carboxylesterase family/Winged helix-turn helix
MAAPVPLRADFDAAALRTLAKQSCDPNQTRRLLALATIYDGQPRSEAARIGCVTLQSVRDWVVRFNAQGPAGLINGKAPGRQAILNQTSERPCRPSSNKGGCCGCIGVRRNGRRPARSDRSHARQDRLGRPSWRGSRRRHQPQGRPLCRPLVGPLRWRAPQPVKPWQGVREAAQFGPSCMQTDNVPKAKDCLTLNVWRPAAAATGPLPVMVWIYGGALVHGGTSIFPADVLARRASLWSA